MNHLTVEITLRSPAAISASSATVGGHESLSYLPGGQLLGAVATALGVSPDEELSAEARDLLLGGVRYGDAWPVLGGAPAFPAPLCLHGAKGEKDGPLANLAVERPTGQFEQLRSDHVPAHGAGRTVPARHHTLRTAIEEKGRAREGFLFGIDALQANQKFQARIDAEDPRLLERVAALLGRGPIRLGRSRSAEFGEATVALVPSPPEPEASRDTRSLRVWWIADLALRCPTTGAPRLQPTPADLGLPDGWHVDWERTFLRTRRYSPFNGARRRPDLERQVIRAGSVVTFAGPPLDAPTLAAVRDRCRWGIGEHVHEGLGRAVVQPAWLDAATVTLPKRTVDRVAVSTRDTPPDDPLGRWVQARVAARRAEATHAEAARELSKVLRSARISKAHWGAIRELARQARQRDGGSAWLARQLQDLLNHGARKQAWHKKEHAKNTLLAEAAKRPPAVIERAVALAVRSDDTGGH